MKQSAIRDFQHRAHRVELDLLMERARWTITRRALQGKGAWREAMTVSKTKEDAAALLSAQLHGAGFGERDANAAHDAWVHLMVCAGHYGVHPGYHSMPED